MSVQRSNASSQRVVTIENGGRNVTASVHGAGRFVVALAPGAGGTRTTPQLLAAASRLDPARYTAVLFHFPYQEAKRKFPDPPAILESTVARVAEFCRAELGARRLFLGGRSMGGRICSQAVSKGLACDGLAFLAYPLHPPGRPDELRDAHLGSIAAPMLFLQGTRDVFARLDLLKTVVARLGSRATLRLFENADHSFKTPRSAAMNSKETEAAMLDALAAWLDALA
jgi:hypothetical protein